MSTHRTMLFDHCVITIPVTYDTSFRPDFDACCPANGEERPTEHSARRNSWLSRRRNLPRAILAGIVILLMAAMLAIVIGITWDGAGRKARIPSGASPENETAEDGSGQDFASKSAFAPM